METNRSVLTLTKVTKKFKGDRGREKMAVEDINLNIFDGEFLVIVGPSGSGKSTLLRIMSGLEKSYQGEVILEDDLKKEDFSFVFQQFAILPWLTAYENIKLGLLTRKISEQERKKAVDKWLQRMGLWDAKDSFPRELSGGMRQRVGIARAFARNPKIVFMDEPFSELDSFTAEELRKEILATWMESKTTIVMVTHLVEEAIELADRIAILTPRPGTIEKIVENTLPRPRNRRSKEFFKLEDELYKIIKP